MININGLPLVLENDEPIPRAGEVYRTDETKKKGWNLSIVVSPIPPDDPQENDLWVDIS